VNSGTRTRLERVVEQLQSKNALQVGNTADPAGFSSLDSSQKQQRVVSASPLPPSSTPSPTIDSLPQSLTEIYDISNRNRWRNKDKKRNRDPSLDAADDEEEEDSKEEAGGAGDDDWYSAGQDAFADKGLEGTVSAAETHILSCMVRCGASCCVLCVAGSGHGYWVGETGVT
jgi:hypothetical protein